MPDFRNEDIFASIIFVHLSVVLDLSRLSQVDTLEPELCSRSRQECVDHC